FSTFGIIGITIINIIKTRGWRRFLSMCIPLAFGLLTLVEIYGKSIVRHPAPPFFLLKNPTTVFPKYHVWEEYSYPSGHAARAMFLALVLLSTIQQYNPKVRLPRSGGLQPRTPEGRDFGAGNITMRKRLFVGLGLGLYVGLVSISRIYLGHHWFSDVIGGLLLGSSVGFIVTLFFARLKLSGSYNGTNIVT
ncbi:MAG: phosphatase PAP2 family protein, partial [Nitrospirota bacterium]